MATNTDAPSKKAPYPVYRAVLHLYPKSYRREYGDQMVQTLQDMLDEATTSLDRTAVWLRAIAETPLHALKENVTNMGEYKMNKLPKVSNKRLVTGGVVVAVLLVGVAIGTGRNAVISGASSLLYSRQVRATATEQNDELSNPLVRLGGANSQFKSQCSTVSIGDIRVQTDCDATRQAYAKLGQSDVDKARILKNVAAITASLKAAGYQSGSNDVTLTSLVAGTYEGKDYSPDAFYQKNIGKDVCTFDTSIAYANPAQPAINMVFSCGRPLYMFGKPKSVTYYSSAR